MTTEFHTIKEKLKRMERFTFPKKQQRVERNGKTFYCAISRSPTAREGSLMIKKLNFSDGLPVGFGMVDVP